MRNELSRRSSLGALFGAAIGTGSPVIAAQKRSDAPREIAAILASREELAASPQRDGSVYVTEGVGAGLFRWESGDRARMVGIDTQRAIHVPPRNDPSGESGAWKRVVDGDIQLAWFGARFDVGDVSNIAEATDDTAAWIAAIAYLGAIGGGTLRLPHGASKITRELTIANNGIRIVGTGARAIYPGAFRTGINCPSTLVPMHKGRSAIRFIASEAGDGSFAADNFGLATLESGPVPEAAFGWETHHGFLYGFTFSAISVHGFTSAFDCYRGDGAENAVGAVLIDNCVINRNRWIARTLDDTQFNGFRFTNNKAGQNGYLPDTGGITISGHDVAIENNILEGMRDAVRVHGGFRDVVVRGNYFEGNVGHACIELRDIRGPYAVGPNNYGLLDYGKINHKVLLKFCQLGTCVDPYWPYGVHKLAPPLYGATPTNSLKNDVDSTRYGFFRLDRMDGMNWSARPPMLRSATAPGVGAIVRETDPQTDAPIAARAHRTAGNGQLDCNFTLSGSAGQWVVLSWLFRRMRDNGPNTDPYVSMKVNGRTVNGSRDYPIYGFSRAWQDGEWCLMTVAIRLQIAMHSLLLSIFPHGIRPAAGRETHHLPPMLYVTDNINKVVPFFNSRASGSVTEAPDAGDWLAGDILRHAAPTPGATMFLCTKEGSPGTWVAA